MGRKNEISKEITKVFAMVPEELSNFYYKSMGDALDKSKEILDKSGCSNTTDMVNELYKAYQGLVFNGLSYQYKAIEEFVKLIDRIVSDHIELNNDEERKGNSMFSLVLMKEKPNIDKFLSEVTNKEWGVILLGDIYRVIEPCTSIRDGAFSDEVYDIIRSFVDRNIEYGDEFTQDDFPLSYDDIRYVNIMFRSENYNPKESLFGRDCKTIRDLINMIMLEGEFSDKGYYAVFEDRPLIDRDVMREKHGMWLYELR
jgi:hypothetical protein